MGDRSVCPLRNFIKICLIQPVKGQEPGPGAWSSRRFTAAWDMKGRVSPAGSQADFTGPSATKTAVSARTVAGMVLAGSASQGSRPHPLKVREGL